MREEKHCRICGKEVFKEDDYYLVQYYSQGSYKSKAYFHRNCFDKKNKAPGANDDEEIKKSTKELIKKTNKMLETALGNYR